jgi:hypothetical protein
MAENIQSPYLREISFGIGAIRDSRGMMRRKIDEKPSTPVWPFPGHCFITVITCTPSHS